MLVQVKCIFINYKKLDKYKITPKFTLNTIYICNYREDGRIDIVTDSHKVWYGKKLNGNLFKFEYA